MEEKGLWGGGCIRFNVRVGCEAVRVVVWWRRCGESLRHGARIFWGVGFIGLRATATALRTWHTSSRVNYDRAVYYYSVPELLRVTGCDPLLML